jgi:hypothetical protein
MPIRINLLAEIQAAEELRRRDPIKRVVFYGALLVALMVVWSSSIKLKAMLANKEVSDRQTQIGARTNEFSRVQLDQKKLATINDNLEQLKKMAECRFLQGNLLNALQQVDVDGVRLIKIKVDQNYAYTPAVRAQKSGDRTIPGRPDSVRERIVVTLEARDYSANPGDQVKKFKQAIAEIPYFKSVLNKTNGVQLMYTSGPQVNVDGKPYVLFTLECHFPEATR